MSTDTWNETKHLIEQTQSKKAPNVNETITVLKNKEQLHFFSSSASISDEIDLLLMKKTTTTIRITIHNECNKYDKSEMNREVKRTSY